MLKVLVAIAASLSLLVGVSSEASAQICAEAVSFTMTVSHLDGAAVTSTNPAQMSEVIRYTVGLCPAMGWTDNYGNSKWGSNVTFDRGIDQGSHWWKVDTADGSHQEKYVYVASAPPPPPPPPPPPSNEITCCITHGGGGVGEEIPISVAQANGVVVPLNFTTGGNGGKNTCWRAADPTSPTRPPLYNTQGLSAYFRKHMQIAHWCAVKGVKIVGSNVKPDWDTGLGISKTSHNAYITYSGATFVKWYSKVDFTVQPWGFGVGLWIEGGYNHYGNYGTQRAGTT